MKNELVATTPDTEQWQRSFNKAFEQEKRAFRQIPSQELAARKGQFVAICEGRIIDEDADELSLAKRVSRLPKDKFILIQQIVEEPLKR